MLYRIIFIPDFQNPNNRIAFVKPENEVTEPEILCIPLTPQRKVILYKLMGHPQKSPYVGSIGEKTLDIIRLLQYPVLENHKAQELFKAYLQDQIDLETLHEKLKPFFIGYSLKG